MYIVSADWCVRSLKIERWPLAADSNLPPFSYLCPTSSLMIGQRCSLVLSHRLINHQLDLDCTGMLSCAIQLVSRFKWRNNLSQQFKCNLHKDRSHAEYTLWSVYTCLCVMCSSREAAIKFMAWRDNWIKIQHV